MMINHIPTCDCPNCDKQRPMRETKLWISLRKFFGFSDKFKDWSPSQLDALTDEIYIWTDLDD